MTTETVELPPLPKPRTIPEGGVRLERWAANEMYDYARQAVLMERERLAVKLGEMDCAHRCRVGHEIATAIRKG